MPAADASHSRRGYLVTALGEERSRFRCDDSSARCDEDHSPVE
jgi:hypothetical protein